MTEQKWLLKGVFYECCRTNGHCPLWFGRDLVDGPCVNLATHEVTEGQIQGVDMKGVIFTYHGDGIGPRYSDLAPGTKRTKINEGALYIADNVTKEQKEILELFLTNHLTSTRWQKSLGVKFVKIEIKEENGIYHITNPYCEQHMALTVGGDQITPIRMENSRNTALSNVKFCTTQLWRYKDYGKNIEFRQTSGAIADFIYSGTD